ncbi:MAG: proline--tRNA ligase, partial [Gammaproteobacteria bacterium TMED225]
PLNIIIGKNYIENEEVELLARNGQSSTNPINDIKTILDFFKSQ